MSRLLALVALTSLMGCMSTKIVYDAKWDPKSKPSYVDYMDSYFLSLWGRPEVSITRVCMDQRPLALHREKTAEDLTLTLITLGIYSPETVSIWCGD